MSAELVGDHSWVFDLIARDDLVRHRALVRHQALLAAALEAHHWSNRVWAQAGTPTPVELHLAAEMDQARAAYDWHLQQTIFGPIAAFWSADRADLLVRSMYAPFAVLYLQWEARYPQEWGSRDSRMSSHWGTKEDLLRGLGRDSVAEEVRPQVTDLIVAALQRPYRCKDWMYARLVRHVSDAQFVSRIETLLDADDPLIRLRAQFILHVVEHPAHNIKRVSWERWLGTDRDT